MTAYGCVYDISTLAIQGIFARMTSGELAAMGLSPEQAMLEYDKATFPTLTNETIKQWCINSGLTLPLLKDVVVLSADKPTFTADGVDLCTVSAATLTSDVNATIALDSGERLPATMTVGTPSFGLTADVPTIFTVGLDINAVHYAEEISMTAT